MAIGLIVLWLKLHRPPKDDPRLSRGLQLLQSKISVLEDLSDRTDAQVKQLTALIDQKARLLQNKIIEAEHQVTRVDSSMQKSKEVAEIFQDKIPHQEIIERQQTITYVKAAQMAHSGRTAQEIADELDLPIGQAELIAKLNKDQLMFDKDALPEWARAQEESNFNVVPSGDLQSLFEGPKEDFSSLQKLGDDFRTACLEFEAAQSAASEPIIPTALKQSAKKMTDKITDKIVSSANDILNAVDTRKKSTDVRKVEFPRIDINDNLG